MVLLLSVVSIISITYFYKLFFYLEAKSIENSPSTSEVEIRAAYTLLFPDPTMWEYTGFVLVVVVVVPFKASGGLQKLKILCGIL